MNGDLDHFFHISCRFYAEHVTSLLWSFHNTDYLRMDDEEAFDSLAFWLLAAEDDPELLRDRR